VTREIELRPLRAYGVAVRLTEDGCLVPAEQADAMAQGLASMNVQDIHVVVTSNFAKTVAQMTGNTSYTADRGGGMVAAKTVSGPEGSVVVVNYDVLPSRPPADVQRILAHEGGHVLIDARSTEETSGNRDSTETDWEWCLKCLGAQAIVELRIERSLAELGYAAVEGTEPSSVEHSLLITNVEVVNAVIDPASDDPAHLQAALLTTLNHVTKMLAYIAAPLAAGQSIFSPALLSLEGRANWVDYVAPTWQQRTAFWSSIPSVTEPIPVRPWRTTLRDSAMLEQALLSNFGFAFSTLSDGRYGFYRTSSDDTFTQRLQRACKQTDTQPE